MVVPVTEEERGRERGRGRGRRRRRRRRKGRKLRLMRTLAEINCQTLTGLNCARMRVMSMT